MSSKGQPKALQVETSAIKAKNRTLDTLLNNAHFTKVLSGLKKGWVFDSQETGLFPHYSNDLRSLPKRLQKLLNHKPRRSRSSTLNSPLDGGHGDTRVPCGSAANPEDRGLKTELNRTEGYHIHTSCVQLAFVDSYTHQATLRTTSFIDDFPIHLWVFIPPSLLDKSLDNWEQAPPIAPPLTGGCSAQNDKVHDAMFSFIAHAPEPIKAQLERLQLLFIMRLKDSFTDFKNSLMQLLVLPSANTKTTKKPAKNENNKKEDERERGTTNKVGGLDTNKDETDIKIRGMDGHPRGHEVKLGQLKAEDASKTTFSSTSSIVSAVSGEGEVSATISGCVLVDTVEACIVLPSILKAQSIESSGTTSTGVASPASPTTPTAGGSGNQLPSIAVTIQRAEEETLTEPTEVEEDDIPLINGNVENILGEHIQISVMTSQSGLSGLSSMEKGVAQGSVQTGCTSQIGLSVSSGGGSATPSPRVSPSPSQSSLTSQTSQSSQFSLSLSNNMSNAHSSSITSLPILRESEMTSSVQVCPSSSGRPSSPSDFGTRPPMRSYSASNLPPLKESPMSNFAAHNISRNTTSVVYESSGYIQTDYRIERDSQSERSSPVVHMMEGRGTGMVYKTQHESEVLWSKLPHESDFVMVEKPPEQLSATGRTGFTSSQDLQDGPVEQGVPAELVESKSIVQRDPLVNEDSINSEATSRLHKSPSRSSQGSLLSPRKAPHSSSASRRSSKSSLSSRQRKAQTPPKTDPLHNLIIKVDGICALPNIQAKEISVRASVSDIELEEVEVAESAENSQSQSRKSQRGNDDSNDEDFEVVKPKVKARIVIGDEVKKLFPDDADELDIILIGKASDLDVSLLLRNALVLADFFDDEFEADTPVPMYLRIENTRVVLLEEEEHGPDHVKSMRLAVDRTDIHRGRKLRDSVDIFLERGGELIATSTETLHEDSSDNVVGQDDEHLQESQHELVQSFNSFLKALEVHLRRTGEHNLPRDQQVVTILRQIQTKSQEATETTAISSKHSEEVNPSTGKVVASPSVIDSPPSYYDTVSTFIANYHHPTRSSPPSTPSPTGFPHSGSAHNELMRLRRENERLRTQEMEYQRENALLIKKKESMVTQLSDFDMVTEECKNVKEQLVAYKQVMEKQHEQMERLLNENTELQRKLALGASGRLNY